MTRERLPSRRGAEVVTIPLGRGKLHIGFSAYPDGRLAEIFASGPKIGSDLRTSLQEAITVASIALQHGASVDELLRALPRTHDDTPEGVLGVILETWIQLCEQPMDADRML